MRLIIKRDQDKGMFGGVSFVLEAKVELSSQEEELIKRYKAHKEIVYTKGEVPYTITQLIGGTREKCKDIGVLLANEEVYKEACQNLKLLLDVMASFGGEEVFEY